MDGIIVVRKEKKMTSHDVVNRLRRILKTKKVGHSGTLDPNVEGVLVVFVNKGCKAIQFMEDTTKQYRGRLRMGIATDTEDKDGAVTAQEPVSLPLDEAVLRAIMKNMIGKQKQIPPMVSAVKINGKKLYEYAREGIQVERKARDIELYDLQLGDIEQEYVSFTVDCSAGTYVRTLCVDIAKQYGSIAHMDELVRTRVGTFTLEQSSTLKEIEEGHFTWIPILEGLNGYPLQECPNIDDVKNGKKLTLDREEPLVLLVHENQAIAMYEKLETTDAGTLYQCVRGLW